ncbi:uncharacterized protein METZ01_LOCUS46001 [marine metagenome]|uniref:Uncharacterized protein n=1 Tax=marine metagenome TaxID=408172 RepID=A0A381RT91_9ZZZZ
MLPKERAAILDRSFGHGSAFGGIEMTRRLLGPFGAATTLSALMVVLATGLLGGQGQSVTPWGRPNLEGIWLDVYSTPFERPVALGDRELATAEERAARDQARMGSQGRNRRGDDGRRDVAGAYNAVYTSAKPAGPRTSLVVDPPNGRIPPLTAEAQRANEVQRDWRLMLLQNTETCRSGARGCAGGEYGPPSPRRFDVAPFYNTGRMNRHDGPEDQSLGDRCMTGRTPDFNGFRRIVQGEDAIAMGYDTGQGQGFQRVIYLDGTHPAGHIRLRHGDSRGRWEGETLVIETTNFSSKFPFRGSGENRRLVERYSRIDEDTLDYEATIEDPTVWTAPWTIRQELKRQSDEQNRIYYEPRCHEGNYGLPALLVGRRVDEDAFAEGRGPNPFSMDTATCVQGLE